MEKGTLRGTEPVSKLIEITMLSPAPDSDLCLEGTFLMKTLDARNRRALEAAFLSGAAAPRVELT